MEGQTCCNASFGFNVTIKLPASERDETQLPAADTRIMLDNTNAQQLQPCVTKVEIWMVSFGGRECKVFPLSILQPLLTYYSVHLRSSIHRILRISPNGVSPAARQVIIQDKSMEPCINLSSKGFGSAVHQQELEVSR